MVRRVTTFIFVKAALRNLWLPPTGPMLLSVIGFALRRAKPRAGAFCVTAGVLLLWLLALPVVGDVLMRHTQRYGALNLAAVPPAGAIVILGGGIRRNAPEFNGDVPNEGSLQRLFYGAKVAKATHLPVLVSGGVVRGGTPEAEVMRRVLVEDLGVPVRWIETSSTDTQENAERSAAVLRAAGIDRIVLVTTGVAMARAVAEFEAQGLRVTPAPVHLWTPFDTGVLAFIPNIDGLVRSNTALYELSGDMVRRARMALYGHGESRGGQISR